MSARKTEYPSVVEVCPSPLSSVSVIAICNEMILSSDMETDEVFSSTTMSGMEGRTESISIANGFSFSASKMYSSPEMVFVICPYE